MRVNRRAIVLIIGVGLDFLSLPLYSKDLGLCGPQSSKILTAAIPDIICVHQNGQIRRYAGCDKEPTTLSEIALMPLIGAKQLQQNLGTNPPALIDLSHACEQHDNCYGTTGGLSKWGCDEQFLQNLMRACSASFPPVISDAGKRACYDEAKYYSSKVRGVLGCEAYKKAQQASGNNNPQCVEYRADEYQQYKSGKFFEGVTKYEGGPTYSGVPTYSPGPTYTYTGKDKDSAYKYESIIYEFEPIKCNTSSKGSEHSYSLYKEYMGKTYVGERTCTLHSGCEVCFVAYKPFE